MNFENVPLIIALFKALVKKGGSYTDLSDKPKINGVVLSGDKSTTDLGIMKHKRLTCDGQHIYDGDQVLTMAQIRTMYEDKGLFVYLEYLNIVFIPGARVSESSTAFEFIGGFQNSGVAYQCRVIINDANVVKYDQIPMETTDNRLDSFEDFDPDAEGAEKVYASALAVLNAIKGKINSPTSVGSPGKVLGLDQSLNTVWLPGGGGSTSLPTIQNGALIFE